MVLRITILLFENSNENERCIYLNCTIKLEDSFYCRYILKQLFVRISGKSKCIIENQYHSESISKSISMSIIQGRRITIVLTLEELKINRNLEVFSFRR